MVRLIREHFSGAPGVAPSRSPTTTPALIAISPPSTCHTYPVGHMFFPKMFLSIGDLDPHVIGLQEFLGPPDPVHKMSTPKNGSRSVQAFLRSSPMCPTLRHADHGTCDICTDRQTRCIALCFRRVRQSVCACVHSRANALLDRLTVDFMQYFIFSCWWWCC